MAVDGFIVFTVIVPSLVRGPVILSVLPPMIFTAALLATLLSAAVPLTLITPAPELLSVPPNTVLPPVRMTPLKKSAAAPKIWPLAP